MSIQKLYNDWSITYDHDENLTRDLDSIVAKKTFENFHSNTVVEIGCGTGKNTTLFSQIAETVYAIDFSEGMIKKAKEKVKSNNVLFSIADISKGLPWQNNFADLIVCSLILEHIENINFVFSEVSRLVSDSGKFFISELHPFRQYEGKKARFEQGGKITQISSFVHNVSDFLEAGAKNNFQLLELKEWWHEKDQNKLPRIISFMFQK